MALSKFLHGQEWSRDGRCRLPEIMPMPSDTRGETFLHSCTNLFPDA